MTEDQLQRLVEFIGAYHRQQIALLSEILELMKFNSEPVERDQGQVTTNSLILDRIDIPVEDINREIIHRATSQENAIQEAPF